jgi:glycogen debranching enzyme
MRPLADGALKRGEVRADQTTRHVHIRAGQRHAWYGPALLVTDLHGNCGADSAGLSGFYFRETRYLSRLRLEVNGEVPWLCAEGGGRQDELAFTYAHPELAGGGGGGSGTAVEELPRDARGLPRRTLDFLARYRVGFNSLDVVLTIANRWAEQAALELAWRLDADYADLLEADAGARQQQAAVEQWAESPRLRFRYLQPGLPLETSAEASGADWHAQHGCLATSLVLGIGESRTLRLRVSALGDEDLPDGEGLAARDERLARWRAGVARVRTHGELPFGRMVDQAMDDLASLALLEGEPAGWLAPAAGAPLYPALFGRDSLTSTWQATVLDQGELLAATLTRLAALQGAAVVPERDEEPGRIIHSLRRGPLARLGLNSYARYYADFASPFMFVISLAQLYAWTGDARPIRRHRDAARRILDWAREYGDRDGDGYLEYLTSARDGPKNQGWKDSGNGIVYEDGRQVPVPLATCEIQGYWYAAQQLFAVLCAALGELTDARAYWSSAAELKERFNRDWWMPEEGFFALALDPEKRPARSITSNVGHCLTSGIIAEQHIRPVVGRLFAPDMFSGWGIRTLSSSHPSYNPISYHLGSVWAVENGTIAFGLRRYGLDARTLDLFEAMVDLAMLYDGYRVPECVGGYARAEFPHPGAYPRANAPQAWNQSTLPLLLQTMLGLQPVAPLHLLAVDPLLPAWLPEVVIEGLRLGGTTATLRFHRREDGRTDAEIVRARGPLRLVRQPPLESLSAGVGDRWRALVESVLP